MGSDGHNDDGARGILPQGLNTDCRNDNKEGQRRVIGLGFVGCGAGVNRDLTDNRVHEEATGKNCRVYSR